MKTPMAHQLEISRAWVERRRVGWDVDPGLGKTFSALMSLDYLHKQDPAARTLVIAPMSVIETAWVKDGEEGFPKLGVTSLWDTTSAKVRKNIAGRWKVGVLNIEQVKLHYDALAAAGIRHMIVDESSRVSYPDTEQTKAVYRLQSKLDTVLLMSGKPAPNSLYQWYAQTMIISNGKAFTYSGHPMRYMDYERIYFYQKTAEIDIGGGRRKRIKVGKPSLLPNVADEFWSILKKWWVSKSKEDCLDLPEKITIIRSVQLSPDEKRAYKDMKETLQATIGKTSVTAKGMAKLMKLRQITSGFLYRAGVAADDEESVINIGTSKLKVMCNDFDTELADKQVVIWCSFRAEVEFVAKFIEKELKCKTVRIVGGMSPDQRGQAINDFRSGKARFFIGIPAACGHGTDGLQGVCSDAAFFSLDYSYDTHNQAMDRIHRIGQKHTCRYWYYLVQQSIDTSLKKSLDGKMEVAAFAREVLS